jgi:hypothetical protein
MIGLHEGCYILGSSLSREFFVAQVNCPNSKNDDGLCLLKDTMALIEKVSDILE